MENRSSTSILIDDDSRRERAKERLYVIFQTAGWSVFWAVQVFFTASGAMTKRTVTLDEQIFQVSINTMVMMLGLLITHCGRRWIARRGWKSLGWRALLPRILGLSAVESWVWVAVGFAWPYGVLGHPLPGASWPLLIALVWVNGTITFAGWHCIYFFYHLFDRLNRSEIERLRLASTVKEAELRALKSQVNPHFIFNSLNSLRALIDEDPARARQSVTQLANLLRYSLQSGQLETVPFEDELRVVNDYLALEQVRHEERLRVRLDIAPETLVLPVPPMLLQTLVENAVKYGISTQPAGGEITIVARCEGGALRVTVSNPGEVAPLATQARTASTGVGLRNAAERLRLLFGERASLQLRAVSPTLVVAEAVLPLPTSSRA